LATTQTAGRMMTTTTSFAQGQFEDAAEATDAPRFQVKVVEGSGERYYFGEGDDFDEDDEYGDDEVDVEDDVVNKFSAAASKLLSKDHDASVTVSVSHRVATSIQKMQAMEEQAKRTLTCGRDDRATSEQVLDPRTRLVLFKLLNTGLFDTLQGCVSTGKEANVYYATAGRKTIPNNKNKKTTTELTPALVNDNVASTTIPATTTHSVREFAVKVYKTSILVFRDRDKYVAGEHRWRHNYCKSNPRKMVNLWAEKEMRNYKRIYQAGIPCPQPILLKSHILVMEFLGHEAWPSPRLKDAKLTEKRLREAYIQCVLILRHLFQKCRLVHGDFSEYNLLWHDNQVYVIDVSQSVESHHPSALDFLRADIANVNSFFQNHKVSQLAVMTTRQLFDFVTNSDLTIDENEQLDKIMEVVERKTALLAACGQEERWQLQHKEQVEEAVFMSRFLPKSLNQVADYTLDKLQQNLAQGSVEESLARDIADFIVTEPGKLDPSTDSEGVHTIAHQAASETEKRVRFAEHESSGSGDQLYNSQGEASDKLQKAMRAGTHPARANCISDNEDGGAEEEEENSDFDDDSLESDDDDVDKAHRSRTPEELQAEREARRAERKANKKAVKEANSEKRRNKLKKKEKKRSIKKTKSGNRKK